jgi:hypothetical protein
LSGATEPRSNQGAGVLFAAFRTWRAVARNKQHGAHQAGFLCISAIRRHVATTSFF